MGLKTFIPIDSLILLFLCTGNGTTKINYILASPSIIVNITRVKILPVNNAFCSDHRLMYVDVNIHGYFRGVAPTQCLQNPVPLPPRISRELLSFGRQFRKKGQEETVPPCCDLIASFSLTSRYLELKPSSCSVG